MKVSLKIQPLDLVIVGLIFHSIGAYIFNNFRSLGYGICGFSILIILSTALFAVRPHAKPFHGFTRIIFYIYLVWIFTILIRPFFFSSLIPLRSGFSPISPFLGLSYFMPLIVFYGISNLPLNSIFKFSYFQALVGVILVIINYKIIFSIPPILDFDKYQAHLVKISFPALFLTAGSFLILFSTSIRLSYKRFAIISVILIILISLIAGRRGGVLMSLILIILAIYLYIIQTTKRSRFFKLLIVAVMFSAGIIIFLMYAQTSFALFLNRIDEGVNSRTGIEEYFFYSFKKTPFDWIFGRGINGTYLSPYLEMPHRNIIETGYLQLILSGGIINLLFFTFFLGYSAYLGFYRSNNILSKAMALYLLYHLIFLYPYGLPSFSFEYLIVWIFILYCQSREWREKSDEEIKIILSIKK